MIRMMVLAWVLIGTTAALADDEPTFGNRTAAEWITILQQDKSPRKREGAVLALSQIGTTSRTVLPALRTALRDDPAPNVRRRIVGAFALVKKEDLGPILTDLVELLKREMDLSVQLAAVNAFGQFGDSSRVALPWLIGAMTSPNPELRAAIAETIGRMGVEGRTAKTGLMGLLDDKEKLVRLYASFALGRIGVDEEAVVALSTRLSKEPEADVRKEIIRALGLIGPTAAAAIAEITNRVRMDSADDVRQEAVLALTRMGPTALPAYPILVETLKVDKDKSVRAFIVRALIVIKGEQAKDVVGELAAALEREEIGDVKLAIIEELGAIGPDALAAIPALQNAQKDVQITVRDAATLALKKIRVKK